MTTRPDGDEAESARRPLLTVLPTVLLAAVVVAGIGLGAFALGRSSSSTAVKGDVATLDAVHSSVRTGATVTVRGSGSVEGAPDTVSFEIGVQTTESTATTALSENDSRISGLEAALRHHDVTKAGMQTSDLSINENTHKGALTGFTVDDDLEVTMHDLSAAGGAIEAAAEEAGNGIQLYGVTYSISNDSALLASARSRAMGAARVEAAALASGAGASLGGVVSVTDEEQPAELQTFEAGDALSASVPLESGSEPVTVEVKVVYELKG